MLSKLKQLFAFILLFYDPKEFDAFKLLKNYINNLNEDYLYQQKQHKETENLSNVDYKIVITKILIDIEKYLIFYNKILSDFSIIRSDYSLIK